MWTMHTGAMMVLVACFLPACQASMTARGSATGSAQGSAQGSGQGSGQASGGPGAPGQTGSGDACPHVEGNDKNVTLPAGTCTGDLVVTGNDNTVAGAGKGQTTVSGRLVLSGNDQVVTGMTVLGPSEISGNDNDASGVEFRANVDVSGTGNKR